MLRDKLKGRKEEEYIAAIEFLLSDDITNRAVKALEKQIGHIVDFFDGTNIMVNLDDKDDKTFDRAQKYLEKLPQLTRALQDLKSNTLRLEDQSVIKEKAGKTSIIAMLQKEINNG